MMFWLIRMLIPPCSSRLGDATPRPQPRPDFLVGSLCTVGGRGEGLTEPVDLRRGDSRTGASRSLGNRIHPTAVVGDAVDLGEGNVIGPYAVVLGPCRMGDDNWIG